MCEFRCDYYKSINCLLMLLVTKSQLIFYIVVLVFLILKISGMKNCKKNENFGNHGRLFTVFVMGYACSGGNFLEEKETS